MHCSVCIKSEYTDRRVRSIALLWLIGNGMLRRFSALIITPIITGLLISLFSILYQGRFNDISNTVIFFCGMTLVYSLLFGLPPYLWLRWKRRYSRKAIVKTGTVVGGIIGLNISIVTSQIGIILVGIVFGFIGSLIFHYIHGTVAITSKGIGREKAAPML